MDEPIVSSDPNAWLRDYWRRLHDENPFFPNLAPELQGRALADAVAQDHPAKAAEIRGWNSTTRRAMLAVLDQALKEQHADKQVELWRMRKGEREVTCVAVYTAVGLDLQLREGGAMLRTHFCRDAPTLLARARQWQKALRTAGWHHVEAGQP
jgi:hypothetical protein